ncbi:MAG: hypothetical protein F6J89_02015 [Symploca sp. SIO1C4]|uniref:Uncharacterized protein n=1 Tax=Symploca sp. SIO1C4 TaxID=2607765 RepID=A0A6B3MYC6_9CYAN|nr:hypothetical protein [Symploca sp. SIO1C4]
MFTTLSNHKNSVFFAVIAAVVITLLENIDTFGLHLFEALIVVIGIQSFFTLWRQAGESKPQEQPTEANSEVPDLSFSDTTEQELPASSEECIPQELSTAVLPSECEETALQAETSEPKGLETEPEKELAFVQECELSEETAEEVSENPGTVEAMRPYLSGFSAKKDWRRLCQHLQLKGYSQITNAKRRAQFLINQGITEQMVIKARTILINSQQA